MSKTTGSECRGTSMGRTRRLAGMAIFTSLVTVLQFVASAIHFGPFSISLVLIPIVIGASLYGVSAGAWLGFVFGGVVLLSGDAGAFLAVNPLGAIVTCLVKGTLSGAAAGFAYRLFSEKNETAATVCAAICAPVVNTGVFLLCCCLFFLDTVSGWAKATGIENVGVYMITVFVGVNFLIELAINIILSPVIIRLIKTAKKHLK